MDNYYEIYQKLLNEKNNLEEANQQLSFDDIVKDAEGNIVSVGDKVAVATTGREPRVFAGRVVELKHKKSRDWERIQAVVKLNNGKKLFIDGTMFVTEGPRAGQRASNVDSMSERRLLIIK